MRAHRRIRFAGTALAVAALSAGGTIAAGALATEDVPPAPTGTPSYAAAAARSGEDPTARVEEMTEVMAQRFPDLADAETTGIEAPDGTQTWVISGDEHTCFGADNSGGTGYTCGTNALAASTPLSLMASRADGTTRGVFLVPDAVRALTVDGETVTPTRNVVVVDDLEQDTALRAVRRDGTAVTLGK